MMTGIHSTHGYKQFPLQETNVNWLSRRMTLFPMTCPTSKWRMVLDLLDIMEFNDGSLSDQALLTIRKLSVMFVEHIAPLQ
eukprot:766871-Hanusia_phi.AAC.1